MGLWGRNKESRGGTQGSLSPEDPSIQRKRAGAAGAVNDTKDALLERGEKIESLKEKLGGLTQEADIFLEQTRQLSTKERAKSCSWGLGGRSSSQSKDTSAHAPAPVPPQQPASQRAVAQRLTPEEERKQLLAKGAAADGHHGPNARVQEVPKPKKFRVPRKLSDFPLSQQAQMINLIIANHFAAVIGTRDNKSNRIAPLKTAIEQATSSHSQSYFQITLPRDEKFHKGSVRMTPAVGPDVNISEQRFNDEFNALKQWMDANNNRNFNGTINEFKAALPWAFEDGGTPFRAPAGVVVELEYDNEQCRGSAAVVGFTMPALEVVARHSASDVEHTREVVGDTGLTKSTSDLGGQGTGTPKAPGFGTNFLALVGNKGAKKEVAEHKAQVQAEGGETQGRGVQRRTLAEALAEYMKTLTTVMQHDHLSKSAKWKSGAADGIQKSREKMDVKGYDQQDASTSFTVIRGIVSARPESYGSGLFETSRYDDVQSVYSNVLALPNNLTEEAVALVDQQTQALLSLSSDFSKLGRQLK